MAAEEAARFIAHAAPLWEQVTHWSVLLQDAWKQSRDPETQAGLIQVMGDRLGQACRSLGLIDAPVEALDARAALVSSIQERHQWAVDAADELRCCGDAQTGSLDERSEQTHELIVNAAIPVHALADKYALTVDTADPEREISSEVLDLTVVLPERWVMVRNDAQVVALAPHAYQVATVDGAGPAGWNYGTAARVRTLRNPAPVSPEELRGRLATVAGSFGVVEDERSLVIDGREAHEFVVLNEESTWRMRIAAVAVGEFTVFVEMGCPMEHEDGCRDLLDSFAAGLRFQG